MEIRIEKAYPAVGQENSLEEEEEGFADGCGFYKLFWLFFISAFLGDLVETVFCRYSMGPLDEPEQPGLGTLQYCVGACDRWSNGTSLP